MISTRWRSSRSARRQVIPNRCAVSSKALHSRGRSSVEPGRVVVVTGAAGGIGAALSRHLASEGAAVIAADVVDPAWDAGGLDVTHQQVDVSDEASWQRLVAAVLERNGRIDALVNNA